MYGEFQDPVEYIVFQVGRLLSWAEDEERKLPRYLDPGPYGAHVDTPREHQARSEAAQDVVNKFRQLLQRFESTQDPNTMIAYIKSVQEHFALRDHTDFRGVAPVGDTRSKIYHEARRNMNYVIEGYETYQKGGRLY